MNQFGFFLKTLTVPIVLFLLFLLCPWPAYAQGKAWREVQRLLDQQDGVFVGDGAGGMIFGHQPDRLLIPASILKIFTALVALDQLGPEYRFKTEFYMENSRALRIKGYGDPMFISEAIRAAAVEAVEKIGDKKREIKRILVDDAYFGEPLVIPGISSTLNPYDAPNGALCANFNTVAFNRVKEGVYISSEPQTPLIPFVLEKIKGKKADSGRIVLSHLRGECALYAGHLSAFFLDQAGLTGIHEISYAQTPPSHDPFFIYHSPWTVSEIVYKLMEFSNNFTANQLLIASGAKASGPPGNLKKAVTFARLYAEKKLGIKGIRLVEGSGISRENRVSARMMGTILQAFAPYCHLLQNQGPIFFKTGTLSNVQSRAGYIWNHKRKFVFAIMINTPNKAADPVMKAIQKALLNGNY